MKEYLLWIKELKDRIRSAQIKAAIKVNTELLTLYWELGKEILEKETQWGGKLVERLSKDLLSEFPEMKGFSVTNLYYIKRWFIFYNQLEGSDLGSVDQILPQAVAEFDDNIKIQPPIEPFVQQLASKKYAKTTERAMIIPQFVGQVPWGHHREIITKCKEINEALFYISKTTEHNWSRSVLGKGKALNNFSNTLPKAQSDLANELLKNPD